MNIDLPSHAGWRTDVSRVLSWILAICICITPVITMNLPDLTSTVFYITLAIAVLLLLCLPRAAYSTPLLTRTECWVFGILLFLPVSILISQLFTHGRVGTELEKAIRISLGLPIMVAALRQVRMTWSKGILLGIATTVVYSCLLIAMLIWPDWTQRPITADVGQYNTVTYSSILLIFAACLFFSHGIRFTGWTRSEFLVKLLLCMLGVIGFLACQTRTGLLALPFFMLLALMLGVRGLRLRYLVLLVVLAAVLGGVAFKSPIVQNRLQLGEQERLECMQNRTDFNSVCIRLQLWGAATDLWKRNFWLGTGNDRNFQKEMQEYYLPKGQVSEKVASGWGEPHNDYLRAASSFGLIGLIGHLLIYAGPLWIFITRMIRGTSMARRCWAAMGASVCIGFFVCGFFETMFRDIKTMGFYAVLLAAMIVLSSAADRLASPGFFDFRGNAWRTRVR